MKYFKTALSFLLCTSMLFMAACESGKDNSSSTQNTEKVSSISVTTEETVTDTQGGTVGKDIPLILKKGISSSRYGFDNAPAENFKKLTDLGVGWYYNWGATTKNAEGLEYVPMVWGAGSVTDAGLLNIRKQYEAGVYKNLLTFNEPDLKEQSNMTVEQALSYWPKLQDIGIRLSSPAPAVYSDGGWLDQFMTEALKRGYRVDFIALHFYQNYSDPNAVKNLKTILTNIYNKYKIPIWITELGEVDTATWTGGYTAACYEEEVAKKYIKEVTDMLENLGFVERYAWFVDNFQQNGDKRPKEAPFTSLYNDDNTISATGKIYKDKKSQKPLIINTITMPKCELDKLYSANVSVIGGTAPYKFSADGLPDGMKIDEKTGKITGKPTSAGKYEVVVNVTDANGQNTHKGFQMMDIDQLKLVKLPKKGWKGIAAYYGIPSGWSFENHDAPSIVDEDTKTAYTMGRNITANDVFQVQFDKRTEAKRIVLTTPKDQYAEGFKVLYCIKDDEGEEHWTEIKTTSNKPGTKTIINLEKVTSCDGLMVQLTKADNNRKWSLIEFDVYGYGV